MHIKLVFFLFFFGGGGVSQVLSMCYLFGGGLRVKKNFPAVGKCTIRRVWTGESNCELPNEAMMAQIPEVGFQYHFINLRCFH